MTTMSSAPRRYPRQRILRGAAISLVLAAIGAVSAGGTRPSPSRFEPISAPGAKTKPWDVSVVTTTEALGVGFALVNYRLGGDVCWVVLAEVGGGGGGCGDGFRDEMIFAPALGSGTFQNDPWHPESHITVTHVAGPVSDGVASVVAETIGGKQLARAEPENGGFLIVRPGRPPVERVNAYDADGVLLRSVATCIRRDATGAPSGRACHDD
jgi:hypothetical protein